MNVDFSLIGKRIKEARNACGMTQEGLAERLNVSVGYVSQVERGVTKISLDLLGAVSGLLKRDVAFFVQQSATETDSYLSAEVAHLWQELTPQNRRVALALLQALKQEQDD